MDSKEERRYFASAVATREDGASKREIKGIAAVIGKRTNIGWFEEEIREGAFDDVLKDDCLCLGNHNNDIIFGRTSNGTLRLALDAEGHLAYTCDMPNTTAGNDWLELIKRGDVKQSSFGFSIKDDEWIERTGQNPLRIIHKVERLYDVSPVAFPAYTSTSVAASRMASALKTKSSTNARVGMARTWLEFNK